jgi:hypothetical protein
MVRENGARRRFYIKYLKKALAACDGDVQFECSAATDPNCTAGNTSLYTPTARSLRTLGFEVVDGIMHVCAVFVAGGASQQSADIAHEFGRYYAHIFGDNTGNYEDDVYMWDRVIDTFASGYSGWDASAEAQGNG